MQLLFHLIFLLWLSNQIREIQHLVDGWGMEVNNGDVMLQ